MGQYATLARLGPDELEDARPEDEPLGELAVLCGHVNARLKANLGKHGIRVLPCDRRDGHPGLHTYETVEA